MVTVSFNSSMALPSFLESIRDAASEAPVTIVADNGSTDAEDIREICSDWGARFIKLQQNKGYGAGINAAVCALPPEIEFVLISNPDVILDEGSIDVLLAAAAKYPRAGSLGPQVVDASGTVYPSARRSPSLRTGIGHALFVDVWPTNPWSARYYNDLAHAAEPVAVEWLSGSCLFVRRSAFEQLGGFDESYFMYFEDVDLGERMSRAGWENLYVPLSRIVHTGAHSTTRDARKMTKAHHASAYRYLSRRYAAWYLWPVRAALSTGLRLRAFVSSRR